MVTERIDRCQGVAWSMLSGSVRSVSLPAQHVSRSRDQPSAMVGGPSPAASAPLGPWPATQRLDHPPAPPQHLRPDPDGPTSRDLLHQASQPAPATPARRVSHPRDQASRGCVAGIYRRLSLEFSNAQNPSSIRLCQWASDTRRLVPASEVLIPFFQVLVCVSFVARDVSDAPLLVVPLQLHVLPQ